MRHEDFLTPIALCEGHRRFCSVKTWNDVKTMKRSEVICDVILTMENHVRIVASHINDELRSLIRRIDAQLKVDPARTRPRAIDRNTLLQRRTRLEMARIMDAHFTYDHELYLRTEWDDPIPNNVHDSRERVRSLALQLVQIVPLLDSYTQLRKIWRPAHPIFTLYHPADEVEFQMVKTEMEREEHWSMMDQPLDQID